MDVEQDLHRGWPPRAAGGDPCSPVDRRQQRSQPPRLLAVGDHVTDPAGTMEIVRPSVPVNLDAAVLAESWSNDTWLADESVLGLCWRGDRERLVREAMLLGSLPAAVPHATVLAAGRTGDHRPAKPALDWPTLRQLAAFRTTPAGT